MAKNVSTKRRSWPPPGGGGLPQDGTAVDVDGHADYNTMGKGRRLDSVAVTAKPTICTACGAMVDPLTMGCRC